MLYHLGASSSTPTLAVFNCYDGVFDTWARFATLSALILFSLEVIKDPSWYIDSGASTGVTNNPSILFNSQPYIGSEQLLVGDGNGLQITYTRSAILDTFTHEPLILNHVPHITKNLLSISKLLTNNNVVEFVDNICYIKARNTWIILLKRIAQKGLYQVQAASNEDKFQHSTSAFIFHSTQNK